METKIVQTLQKEIEDNYSLAEKYYSILSAVNNLKLTQREIQLVAFTAVRGNMSYANVRKDFCDKYNSTSPTINNIISKLKRLKVFIKDKGKIRVNPAIIIDFNKDAFLIIKLLHKPKTT